MSVDKIQITYVEFDNDQPGVTRVPRREVLGLYYADWRRSGNSEWGFADRSAYVDNGAGEVCGIPDDVRVALALIVAPGLVGEMREPRRNLLAEYQDMRAARDALVAVQEIMTKIAKAREENLAKAARERDAAVAALTKARAGINASLRMRDLPKPEKLDAALSWRQNDELADAIAAAFTRSGERVDP